MPWYSYVAHFFAASFWVNAIPHFVQGLCGQPFQSPFAKPPGVGESPPLTNVLWGGFNIAVGYLLMQAGAIAGGLSVDTLVIAMGGLVTALMLANHFGKVRAQR